ncbi:MAG: GNAT family N-acetyltransferase [Hyphomicrobiaceae bacterium]|nr:GNAT family N-acetyltransferase [Hyphomicrobiaceae bacterium]
MPLWSARNAPEVRSDRLLLRLPQASDFAEWRDLRLRSRDHLEPFEPSWSDLDYTRPAFSRRLRRAVKQAREGTDYSFFVFARDGRKYRLAGGLTLSNVRFAVACHANLGYWTGAPFAGQGIMTEAVGLACGYAFDKLGLNRVHAAFLPHNAASRRVLEKNGFVEEGFAEHYLKINGRWEDHVLFGLTRARRDADAILALKDKPSFHL